MTLLARHAENLFWIGRYVERAETTARLLEVGSRNALIPQTGGGMRNEWEAILRASGTDVAFGAKYGDTVQRNIESHMILDAENMSSIASCFRAARENGRIVRTALTSQVWDALNTAHREMEAMKRVERSSLKLSDVTDWTIRAAAQIRGAVEDTQLRIDSYHFMNLGQQLERGDATARLLDVKYFVLLPSASFVGSGLDTYQWRTILRALNAHRAYAWVYGGDVTPARVAHFLILNPKSPRSLIAAAEEATRHLEEIARDYGRSTDAQSEARSIVAFLADLSVEDIFDEGLHEFLTRTIRENAALSSTIAQVYLSGETR